MLTREQIWNDVAIKSREKNVFWKCFGEFNKAFVSGQVEEELKYSHEVLGESFYKTIVRVMRRSTESDYVPILLSERLIPKLRERAKGKWIEVSGEFRSRPKMEDDGKRHTELFLFVKDIQIYETKEEMKFPNYNVICLEGLVCKPPIFRTTPLTKCEIAEVMITVKRDGDVDLIPCIAWRDVARYASDLEVKERVILIGRIQSRIYHGDRTAYEVSCRKLVVEEELG